MSAFFCYDRFGPVIDKSPGAVLDYAIDWSMWLEQGENIQGSQWETEAGIFKTGEQLENARSIIFLSGGVVGDVYRITNKIITSASRIEERGFRVRVIQR